YLSAAVTIVMAQELLPHRASVASSIVMGLAWGTAGLSLTAIGALADAIGLERALRLLLLLAVPALAAVQLLPKAKQPILDAGSWIPESAERSGNPKRRSTRELDRCLGELNPSSRIRDPRSWFLRVRL